MQPSPQPQPSSPTFPQTILHRLTSITKSKQIHHRQPQPQAQFMTSSLPSSLPSSSSSSLPSVPVPVSSMRQREREEREEEGRLGRVWVLVVVGVGIGVGLGILGLVWGSLGIGGRCQNGYTQLEKCSTQTPNNINDTNIRNVTNPKTQTPIQTQPQNNKKQPQTLQPHIFTSSTKTSPSTNTTNPTSSTNTTLFSLTNFTNQTVYVQENVRRKWVEFQFVLREPEMYMLVWRVLPFAQLPFCVFVEGEGEEVQKVVDSITHQTYKNYIIHNPPKTNTTLQKYHQYKHLLHKSCPPNALLLIAQKPLAANTLRSLNMAHQNYFTWATYSRTPGSLQVYSFYSRIFDMIQGNDFFGDNLEYMGELGDGDFGGFLAVAVVELCQYHMMRVQGKIDTGSSFLDVGKEEWKLHSTANRTKYARLYKLSQDYKVDLNQQQQRWSNYKTPKRRRRGGLTPKKMQITVHRQQLPYLPQTHSLNFLQSKQSSTKYQINNYQSPSQQVPFCVTVLSHNNIAQNRYRKAMMSVLQQKYENYRVVFVDDGSEDGNMEKTIEVVREMGHLGRVRFVQNRKRMHTTYNIVNAALNFCGEDQVQLLLDGDDEIIGKHAFSIMNSGYQKNKDAWIVYSTFKTNLYTYGTSRNLSNLQILISPNNTRVANHVIGPIRSWRTKLLYPIPLAYHQNSTGQWLDTLYDEALQHSIVQMAGIDRVVYLEEMMYQYNKQHGDNDDATLEKLRHRKNTYQWVLGLQVLEQLEGLGNVTIDQDVARELKQGNNTIYYQIFPK